VDFIKGLLESLPGDVPGQTCECYRRQGPLDPLENAEPWGHRGHSPPECMGQL